MPLSHTARQPERKQRERESRLPHGVLVGGRQSLIGHRGAVVGSHDALSQ